MVNDMPLPHIKVFIVRPFSAVGPSSVTDNLRGKGVLCLRV